MIWLSASSSFSAASKWELRLIFDWREPVSRGELPLGYQFDAMVLEQSSILVRFDLRNDDYYRFRLCPSHGFASLGENCRVTGYLQSQENGDDRKFGVPRSGRTDPQVEVRRFAILDLHLFIFQLQL